MKSWVNFIHKKTPLNHSAVLIWNLDLASTRSTPHEKSIPVNMCDVSPEELRLLKYTSSNDEYVKYEKILGGDYKEMRCNMLRSQVKVGICGTPMKLCREADNIIKFLVEEVYILQLETTVKFCSF